MLHRVLAAVGAGGGAVLPLWRPEAAPQELPGTAAEGAVSQDHGDGAHGLSSPAARLLPPPVPRLARPQDTTGGPLGHLAR